MSDIINYSKDAFQVISQCQFLNDDNLHALKEMSEELQDTWQKKQMWRTETEMRVSVLNDLKHPTPDSKYWQAIREQSVFFENLVTLSFEYQRIELKIRRLQKELESIEDKFDREDKEIDLAECFYRRKNMELAAKDRMREIKLWSKIKKELEDQVIDKDDVNTHQLISYGKRFIHEVLTMNPESASPAELRNIVGLAQTTLRKAHSEGVLEEVLRGFSEENAAKVLQMAGFTVKKDQKNSLGKNKEEFLTQTKNN